MSWPWDTVERIRGRLLCDEALIVLTLELLDEPWELIRLIGSGAAIICSEEVIHLLVMSSKASF